MFTRISSQTMGYRKHGFLLNKGEILVFVLNSPYISCRTALKPLVLIQKSIDQHVLRLVTECSF